MSELQEKITVTESIVAYVRTERKRKKITGYDLSTMIGKSLSFIQSLESNRLKNVELHDMEKIVVALSDLMKREDVLLKISELQNTEVKVTYQELLLKNIVLSDENMKLRCQIEQIREILRKPIFF